MNNNTTRAKRATMALALSGFGFVSFAPAAHAADNIVKDSPAAPTVTTSALKAPTASPDLAIAPFEKLVNIKVLGNDEVTEENAVWGDVSLYNGASFEKTITNSDGTYVVKNDMSVDFQPAAGFSGMAKPVTYRVTDSNGQVATSTLNVTVKAETLRGVNDTATTKQGTKIVVDVLKNDVNKFGKIDSTSLVIFDKNDNPTPALSVVGGEWTVANGKLVFTPKKGFIGQAGSVEYGARSEASTTFRAIASVKVEKAVATKPPTTTPKPPVTTPKPPVTGNPPVTGPIIQTDMVGGNDGINATGVGGALAAITLAGFVAARRKR